MKKVCGLSWNCVYVPADRRKRVEIFFSPNLTSAYRQQYGSVNPAGIIGPAIVATFVSTAVAVMYCKIKDRRRRV